MAFKPSQTIVLMFLATQLLALWAGVTLTQAAQIVPEVKELSVAPSDNPEDPLNAAFFLGYVLFGAAMVLLVIKFVKGRFLFRLLEFCMLFGSVSVLLIGLFHSTTLLSIDVEILLSMVIGFAFALVKFFKPGLKNIAAVLSSAGVGALFGFSMGFIPAILFIIGISLYDFIAVFMTRHMLAISSALGTRDLSFTVTAAASSPKPSQMPVQMHPSQHSHSGHATTTAVHPLSAVQTHRIAPAPQAAPEESEERLDLGSGDLAVPAMLAVSVYPFAGIAGSFAVVAGATISLYLLLDFVVTRRVALPAMPPISLGALIFLLIALLLGA